MCRYGAAELHAVAAFIGKHSTFQFSSIGAIALLDAAGISSDFYEKRIEKKKEAPHSFICLICLVIHFSFYIILFIAYAGGCAAQEVIKLITKQYVPLDNTFIFNSVTTTTATLRL